MHRSINSAIPTLLLCFGRPCRLLVSCRVATCWIAASQLPRLHQLR
ncbi:hypothetical protein M758_5G062500 [Ceratodon purpureus]|nr:hypothetical protein M758_5G062500 [Ceratodon purpureus]